MRLQRLEPRQMLTTVINVTTTEDTLAPDDGETSLREAIIQAHEESDPDVHINLLGLTTHELTRPTNFLGTGGGTVFTEGTSLDPMYGDLDISRDLTIVGGLATIDANDGSRLFEITGGVDVDFLHLTLRDGQAAFSLSSADTHLQGGAVRADNPGGRVRFFNSRLVSNGVVGTTADSQGDEARGGAIYVDGGTLVIDDTVVELNDARGGPGDSDNDDNDVNNGGDGGDAFGGAIYAEDATVRIRNGSIIRNNDADGGRGGDGDDTGGHGGSARGGGVYLESGLLNINGSTFESNEAGGGRGGDGTTDEGGNGGAAFGGAVYIAGEIDIDFLSGETRIDNATLSVTDSAFRDNLADGGRGGNGHGGSPAGGRGGGAEGGAIFAGHRVDTMLDRTDIERNKADAGNGGAGAGNLRAGRGGNAQGGGLVSFGELLIDEGLWDSNEAEGGRGGAYVSEAEGAEGGRARGGAIYAAWASSIGGNPIVDNGTSPVIDIVEATLTNNIAQGGGGSDAFNNEESNDGGDARGGALFVGEGMSNTVLFQSQVSENRAVGGRGGDFRNESPSGGNAGDGGEASGGGIDSAADSLRVLDTTMLANTAQGGSAGNTRRGQAGNGGAAEGGAIRQDGALFVQGELEVLDPEFNEGTITASISGNSAIGGTGGAKRDTDDFFHEDEAGDGGRARGGGIAVYGDGAEIVEAFMTDNRAMGGAGGNGAAHPNAAGVDGGNNGDAYGGAIYAEAQLDIEDSALVFNKATGGNLSLSQDLLGGFAGSSDDIGNSGGDGGDAFGGAVYVFDRGVSIAGSGLSLNTALGGYGAPGAIGPGEASGNGGDGGDASGGALHVELLLNDDAEIDVVHSTLLSNVAIAGRGGSGAQGRNHEDLNGGDGGRGGEGGDAFGGAATVQYLELIPSLPDTGGDVSLVDTIVSSNRAIGGDGGYGGAGGWTKGDTEEGNFGGGGGENVSAATWVGGGGGGDALGGGLYLLDVSSEIERTTIAENIVSSGWGGNGGHGGGSYFWGGSGGDAGDAGLAAGGGVARVGGALEVSHSTIADNTVIAGFGGNGGYGAPGVAAGFGGSAGDGGDAFGGGIYSDASSAVMVTAATIARNVVNAGNAGFIGLGAATLGNPQNKALSYRPAEGSDLVLGSNGVISTNPQAVDPTLEFGDADDDSDSDLEQIFDGVFGGASVLVGGGLGGGSAIGASVALYFVASTSASLEFATGATSATVTLGGTLAVTALPAATMAAVGMVWVHVGLTLTISLASGNTFEEAVVDVLGEPGPIYGPNIGVLFVGGNGPDNDELDPPVRDGDDGLAGSAGNARGPGIYGAVDISRTIVAENEARRRSFTRTETVITECLDPNDFQNDIATVIECPESGLMIHRETSVFELTQDTTELNRNEVAGGSIDSDGTNLVGVANTGFTNPVLTGTFEDPLDARLAPELAFNGGTTPTIALLPDSIGRRTITILGTEVSQNDFTWDRIADIGAWGGARNVRPQGVADEFTILEGETLVVDDRDVLADNDDDPNEDLLTVASLDNETPGIGAIVGLVGDDGFEYHFMDSDFFGHASLSYVATDGEFDTASTDVTINVLPVNDAPQALASDAQFVNDGSVTATGFASIDPGPDNESGQSALGYATSNLSNPGLFESPPVVAPDGTLSFTPVAGASGEVTFDLVAQDDGGVANGGLDTSDPLSITLSIDAPAPQAPAVIDLIVAGSEWSSEFIDAVDGAGAGAGNGLGYSLVGAHQAETLPWTGVDTIHVVFSDDVSASLTSDDVALVGTNGGAFSIGDLAHGVGGQNIATITIDDLASGGLATDSLALSIADGAVEDSGGAPLDGDWATGQSGPSGDATAGGRFDFFFNVLHGDANASAQVNSTDALNIFSSNTFATTEALARRDINGSGQITSTDAILAFANNAAGLPPAPEPAAFAAPQASGALVSSSQTGRLALETLAGDVASRVTHRPAALQSAADARAEAFAEQNTTSATAQSSALLLLAERVRAADGDGDTRVALADRVFSDMVEDVDKCDPASAPRSASLPPLGSRLSTKDV